VLITTIIQSYALQLPVICFLLIIS